MMLFSESSCIKLQKESINLKHKVRQLRYLKVLDTLFKMDISFGFPSIFKCQYDLKAFYRLINNESVNQQDFISGYQKGLNQYSQATPDLKPWVLIQDSMFLDFNTRQVDLGYTQTPNSNGFMLHHGLLLDDHFTPLGLYHQEVFFRERENFSLRRVSASGLCGIKREISL